MQLLTTIDGPVEFHEKATEIFTFIIDVSHHQGDIDFSQVKAAGVDFAYIKASQGTTFQDPNFLLNAKHAREHGVRIGAYHFLSSQSPADDQAKSFLHIYSPIFQSSDLPPALDLEWDIGGPLGEDRWNKVSCQEIVDAATTWLGRVEDALERTPLLYVSPAWWKQHNSCDASALAGYPLWIPSYADPSKFDLSHIDEFDIAMWQYTDGSKIKGIDGNIDRSVLIDRCPTLVEIAPK